MPFAGQSRARCLDRRARGARLRRGRDAPRYGDLPGRGIRGQVGGPRHRARRGRRWWAHRRRRFFLQRPSRGSWASSPSQRSYAGTRARCRSSGRRRGRTASQPIRSARGASARTCFPIAQRYVERVVLVDDAQDSRRPGSTLGHASHRRRARRCRPLGGSLVAPLRPSPKEERIGVVVSGGNTVAVDFNR